MIASAGEVASYVGLVPSEESGGDWRRLGHTSKQGDAPLRFLLLEAAQLMVRSQPAPGPAPRAEDQSVLV